MAQLLESEQVGKPDSWADLVANVEVTETPYSSRVRKVMKPRQVEHHWQMKRYKVTGHKGVEDGKDASQFNTNPRVEAIGVAQKSWDLPAVSDFAEEAEIAGVPKGEMAEQIADAMVAVKHIIEKRCLSNEDQKRQTAANQVNETRGIFSWGSPDAQTLYPVDAGFRPAAAQRLTGGLATGFSEGAFLAAMRSSYKIRRGPKTMTGFVGIDLKAKFTDFGRYQDTVVSKVAVRQFNQDAKTKTFLNVIDRLVLDTGEVELMPTTFLMTTAETGLETDYTHRSGVFHDMEMAGLAFTRNPRFKELENKGGGRRGIVDTIFFHMIDNPQPMVTVLLNSDN